MARKFIPCIQICDKYAWKWCVMSQRYSEQRINTASTKKNKVWQAFPTKQTQINYVLLKFEINKVNWINLREDNDQTQKTKCSDKIVSTKLTMRNKVISMLWNKQGWTNKDIWKFQTNNVIHSPKFVNIDWEMLNHDQIIIHMKI